MSHTIPTMAWGPSDMGRACGILEVLQWVASNTAGSEYTEFVDLFTREVVHVQQR